MDWKQSYRARHCVYYAGSDSGEVVALKDFSCSEGVLDLKNFCTNFCTCDPSIANILASVAGLHGCHGNEKFQHNFLWPVYFLKIYGC